MNNYKANTWGVSIKGPLHAKKKLPNQDAWLSRRYHWGYVLVVADGLGSKNNSDFGAKKACEVVVKLANECAQKLFSIADLPQLIHSRWLLAIQPFNADQCATTCLFVIALDNEFIIGQLGDGLITLCANKTDCYFIEAKNKDNFSNYTSCLHHKVRAEDWVIEILNSENIDAVFLCTDGISDDLLIDKRNLFFKKILHDYAQISNRKRKKEIRTWLKEWPVPAHTDDKTIACLLKVSNN